MLSAAKRYSINRVMVTLLVVFNCLTIQSVFAENLNDVIKQAVLKDVLTAAQSEQFQAVTSNVSQLAGLTITSATIDEGTIRGEVEFLKLKWKMLAFSNGGAKNTFITFSPKKDLMFSQLFKNVPGIKLLDVIRFDQQIKGLSQLG